MISNRDATVLITVREVDQQRMVQAGTKSLLGLSEQSIEGRGSGLHWVGEAAHPSKGECAPDRCIKEVSYGSNRVR
ncbi:MAG: hypothetical protein ACJ74Y_14980 [Bryobacteraceae bacterium]